MEPSFLNFPSINKDRASPGLSTRQLSERLVNAPPQRPQKLDPVSPRLTPDPVPCFWYRVQEAQTCPVRKPCAPKSHKKW